jgi:biotin transport system substrate-specific component
MDEERLGGCTLRKNHFFEERTEELPEAHILRSEALRESTDQGERMKQEVLSLRGTAYAAMFGAITAVGAYIIIPFPLVPITMQTFFVSLAPALLGGALGALSQVIYILIGVIGFPVFAGGKAGFGVLMGPTGGYLVGFIVGAYIIGTLIEMKKKPSFIWMVSAMVIGHIALYTLGIAQLMFVTKLSLGKAFAVGVIPTLPGGIVKIVAAAFIAVKLKDKVRFP